MVDKLSSHGHETCHHAIALLGAGQRAEKAEAALAAVTQERDEAVAHLWSVVQGPAEFPPKDCDEDYMDGFFVLWGRLVDCARDWLATHNSVKEGAHDSLEAD
jgi:hypothetical protein